MTKEELFVSLQTARAMVETARAALREDIANGGDTQDADFFFNAGYKLAAMDDAVSALTNALS